MNSQTDIEQFDTSVFDEIPNCSVNYPACGSCAVCDLHAEVLTAERYSIRES